MKRTPHHPIKLPPRILVLWVKGPFFFGVLENLERTLVPTHTVPQALVISLRRVPFMETNGLRTLEETVHKLRAHGISVLLIEANEQVKTSLEQCGLLEAIGRNCYYDAVAAAGAYCCTLNGGIGDHRLMVIDAYAESMLITSCDYLRDNPST